VAATGRIFVRLAEGQRAVDQGAAFRGAGYENRKGVAMGAQRGVGCTRPTAGPPPR